MQIVDDKNILDLTKSEFQPFTEVQITDEIAEDIKGNLVSLFRLLLSWREQEEDMIYI